MNAQAYIIIFFTSCCLIHLSCTPNSNPQEGNTQSQISETPPPSPSTPRSTNLEGIAESYENTNRVIWQKPEVVINLLGDLSDKVVADVGAGRGYFSLRLAPKTKKVIAIDIDSRFIDHIDSIKMFELPEDAQDKLETRLALPNDPKLEAGEADVILIVNTFIYIKDKLDYLQRLSDAMPEGGQLLIIDFKKKRTPLGPPSDIRLPLYEVENMLIEAGYTDVSANDTVLDYQYIVTARK
jgi:SAM-dependent methyltransferase